MFAGRERRPADPWPSSSLLARRSMRDAAVSVRNSFNQVPAESRHLMEDGCRQAATTMTDALNRRGCP